MDEKNSELIEILKAGIALSKESDRNRLLYEILEYSMRITHCDGGLLYMAHEDRLHIKVMRTFSLGLDKGRNGEAIGFPPVPLSVSNICAYTVLSKKPVNVADAYASDEFDFSFPRRYDRITGYHTKSLMTIPLMDQDENTVGVMQLMNAMDQSGNVIPFEKRMEFIITSLASQAAIAMTNIRYMDEIKDQMWSFTEAMAETIDARTPYNASHIRMVSFYAGRIADRINQKNAEGTEKAYFTKTRKEELMLSALLHDMGKAVIPTKIMNKSTRLEEHLQDIVMRFQLFKARYKIQLLQGKISQEQYEHYLSRLNTALNRAQDINFSDFVPQEQRDAMAEYLDDMYVGEEGSEPYFTKAEKECLMIKRGTLTDAERKIMESHVNITERILSKVHFNSQFQEATVWAAQHHELLDGSGYPRHLKGDELPLESRILAVSDICDALLATDRPYKKPLPKEKAFAILHDMASKGKLDEKIVCYLEESI